MVERERKQWQSELDKRREESDTIQQKVKSCEDEIKELSERIKELEEEIDTRETCEAKVQEYVKTLVKRNDELQKKLNDKH